MAPTRHVRRFEPHGDLALGVALAGLGLCELSFPALNADFPGPRLLNALLVVAMAIPVVWRRRAPVAALLVFWLPVQIWLDVVYDANSSLPLEPFLILLLLVYSASLHASERGERVVLVLLGLLVLSELALLAAGLKGWGNVVPGLVFISIAYLTGQGIRRRHLHARTLEQRATVLEAEQEAVARRAVAEERDRMARELHDVIAHSVSVMVVQAGAAERLLERDPGSTRDALATIREAGGEALDELNRLVGLLRDAPDRGIREEPQPGLSLLDRLIEQTRAAGIPTTRVIEGEPRPLPPGIDLAAYRVVQEALTNIRKHAGRAQAEVRITYTPTALAIRVADDGTKPADATPDARAGHGLIGMRERVALYGGTITVGPLDVCGFAILATFPLAASVA